MLGYSNYKTLYKEEYNALKDEGYNVLKYAQPSADAPSFLTFPNECDSYDEGEDKEFWKKHIVFFFNILSKENE